MKDNEGSILIAQARRHNRPHLPKDYVDLGFKLVDLIKANDIIITVLHGGDKHGSFSTDNYGSLPLFFLEKKNSKESTVVVIRRFEKGPKINTKIPYKTVCSMFYVNGEWIEVSEENLKFSYSINAQTGEPIELEEGILFSTVSETFPDLLK